MRITCPSCQSEYDVAAAAIGDKGRMVRCANCGGEWFQSPEDEAPVSAPVEEVSVVDDYQDVPEPIEDEVERPVAEVVGGVGYRIIDEAPAKTISFDSDRAAEQSFPAAHDDYVPNRHSETRDTDALTASLHEDENLRPATGGGVASFIGGFATSAVLVGLFAAVYVAAPSIVDAIPALEPAMNGYVGIVEKGRIVLGVLVGG